MPVVFETVDEILDQLDGAPPFIVDGLISTEATLLYGQPKAGKGFLSLSLVHALVTGESAWLGRALRGGPYSVAIGVTDPGGKRETATRLGSLGVRGDRVRVLDIRPDTDWTEVARSLVGLGVNVFILDNMLGALPSGADVRQASDTRPVTDVLTRLVDVGVAVIAVHHEGKLNVDGRSGGAMGSQQLTAWPRSILKLSNTSGSRALKVSGNHVETHTMRLDLTVTDHDGFWFTSLGNERQQSGAETARQRGRSRLDYAGLTDHVLGSEAKRLPSRAAVAAWLVDNPPPGMVSANVDGWKTRLGRCGLVWSADGWSRSA